MAANLFFVAGERSGDLHAGNLISSLQNMEPDLKFSGYGGDRMEKAGCRIIRHYSEYSVMGFWEVLTNLGRIRRYLRECRESIREANPDAVVLVDFGGFNMKIAEFCHAEGIPVIYYILPKVWAWNRKRAKKIARWVNKALVILPFEEEFFRSYGIDALYVGNPVNDEVREFLTSRNVTAQPDDDQPVVTLLPGSRKQEVLSVRKLFFELAGKHPGWQFKLAAVDNIPKELYEAYNARENISLVSGDTYSLLDTADAAVVVSGTATLETALLHTPQVVVYRTSWVSYMIAKRLVRVKWISLVNLILDREAVCELIQGDASVERLSHELQRIMEGGEDRSKQLAHYRELREILGEERASDKAASEVMNILRQP